MLIRKCQNLGNQIYRISILLFQIDLPVSSHARGHEAQHAAQVGKAGWKDWNLARYAAEGDFVLVTNNASDFRFRAALDAVAISGDLINCVLEINIDGGEALIDLYDLPIEFARHPPRGIEPPSSSPCNFRQYEERLFCPSNRAGSFV